MDGWVENEVCISACMLGGVYRGGGIYRCVIFFGPGHEESEDCGWG
jgi:hypothetical protein